MDEHGGFAPARPFLTIGRGWAVYVGPVEAGRPHRHQAAQLAWCPSGMLTLEGSWGSLQTRGHMLPAGVVHRLVAAQPIRMVFIDPSMLDSARSRGVKAEVTALTALQADALELELADWVRREEPSDTPRQMLPPVDDDRWTSVVRWVEQALEGRVRVEDAAANVGLSASRFMHWFREASGLSFRAFVRWMRLQEAVRILATGATLTEAAHLAGFADSAHLTRTFVATFGVRPALLRDVLIVCSQQGRPPVGLLLLELSRWLYGKRPLVAAIGVEPFNDVGG